MSAPKDGGPITSGMQPDGSNGLIAIGGLSKREYFAAMAMQAILSNSEAYSNMSDGDIARNACDVADALLKALSQEVAS